MDHLMRNECRACGCTDLECTNCIEKTGAPCYWIEENLCSACVGDVKAIQVTFYFKDGTGKRQTMSFEMDLIIGNEWTYINSACETLLLDKGFFNTSNHKVQYKFLKNIA